MPTVVPRFQNFALNFLLIKKCTIPEFCFYCFLNKDEFWNVDRPTLQMKKSVMEFLIEQKEKEIKTSFLFFPKVASEIKIKRFEFSLQAKRIILELFT